MKACRWQSDQKECIPYSWAARNKSRPRRWESASSAEDLFLTRNPFCERRTLSSKPLWEIPRTAERGTGQWSNTTESKRAGCCEPTPRMSRDISSLFLPGESDRKLPGRVPRARTSFGDGKNSENSARGTRDVPSISRRGYLLASLGTHTAIPRTPE